MRLRSISEDAPGRVSPTDRATAERLRHARLLEAGDKRVDPLVVAAFDTEDPIALLASQLRGTLAGARKPGGEAVRLVALIGVDAAAETAIIAANTAVACAQGGYRTLLIDGALEAPAQHDLFRMPNRAGLSTLLAGPDGDRGAVQNTAIAALSLLPAGPSVPNGDQLFDRARLFQRLRGSMDRYDLALLVAPAPIAVAAAAAEGLDGALLVTRRNVSSARALESLVGQLAERGTPLMGTIQVD